MCGTPSPAISPVVAFSRERHYGKLIALTVFFTKGPLLRNHQARNWTKIALQHGSSEMDLILRNARVLGKEEFVLDVGISDGRIAAIEPNLQAEGQVLDLAGRLASPGLIETHIHLDKSNILGRCRADKGDLEEAIQEVAKAKKSFTSEDVYERGKRTLERCILNGTTHMRTQLEVDPGIGLRGLEGIKPLVKGIRLGDRYRDLHLSAGRAAQQSRYRRVNDHGAEVRRQGRGRRTLHRQQPPWTDRSHFRDGARVRHRRRHALWTSAPIQTISICSTSASRRRSTNGEVELPSATSPNCRRHRRHSWPSAHPASPTPVSR